jgi:ABC-type antimicrobial peptide transport system permease subunit
MNKMKVFSMIVLETGFLIMTGAPVGLLLGLGTVAILHQTGIHLTRYAEAYSSFGYAPDIYPVLYGHQLGMIVAMILATAVLAAVFPARRALRLNPADALKS